MSNDIRIGNVCENCDDGSGQSVFPHYGVAPHHCGDFNTLGTAKVKPESEWPEYFVVDTETVVEDSDYPPGGVYLYCPACKGACFDAQAILKSHNLRGEDRGLCEDRGLKTIGFVTEMTFQGKNYSYAQGECSIAIRGSNEDHS